MVENFAELELVLQSLIGEFVVVEVVAAFGAIVRSMRVN
jgi:hypothetical protein